MKYAFEFLISVFGILATMNSSNAVEGSPQQLLGKSVVVTWNENRIQRAEGESKFREVNATQSMSIYIGSSGRIFSRLTNTVGSNSGRIDHVQEQSAGDPNVRKRVTTFNGRSMTLDQPLRKSGHRHLLVDFGDKFDNCSAKLSYVTEAGSPTSLARSPITNKMVEIKSIAMTGENCSISPGNVFGDE
jgi:hypothetical protein